MRWLTIVLTLVITPVMAHAQAKVCDVHEYGAKGDGITKDTAAIQQAIDTCATAGGGMVKIAGKVFLSGPIVLKSNITLDIETGTTLLGSPDHADYPAKTEFRAPGYQALIGATGAEDVTITGGGVIDGNGTSWWVEARQQKNAGVLGSDNSRPRGVVFDHCKHIKLENITVQNSPMWQIVPYYSDDVILRNMKVLADPHSPNTDGIDPFSSTNIVIDHVTIDVGDDNVAIKSGMIDSPGPDSPTANVTIHDCTFLQGHGLSIGSELAGGAQHILAERITFKGTDNGVRVKANRDRGADISDITFRDITMEDVKIAILISEYYPKAYPEGKVEAAPIGRLTPFFHDIHIENLKAKGSKTAGIIIGLPEAPAKGVTLKNVKISADTGMKIAYAEVKLDHVKVSAASGAAMTISPTAQVVGK